MFRECVLWVFSGEGNNALHFGGLGGAMGWMNQYEPVVRLLFMFWLVVLQGFDTRSCPVVVDDSIRLNAWSLIQSLLSKL